MWFHFVVKKKKKFLEGRPRTGLTPYSHIVVEIWLHRNIFYTLGTHCIRVFIHTNRRTIYQLVCATPDPVLSRSGLRGIDARKTIISITDVSFFFTSTLHVSTTIGDIRFFSENALLLSLLLFSFGYPPPFLLWKNCNDKINKSASITIHTYLYKL